MLSECNDQWLFSDEALAQAREAAHEHAVQALQGIANDGAERRQAVRELPKALTMAQCQQLVLFYVQKLPELCNLCAAPAEVRWTAIVFYRRFFAVRSPMEFDPLPVMFACVHLACKIEEVHEITLDKLLEAADFGLDKQMKTRVSALELPLLEGVGFHLLVEPKPDAAVHMLGEELQQRLATSMSPPTITEVAWRAVISRAENIVLDLSLQTDAILRWPAAVVITTAFRATLQEHFGQSPSLLKQLLDGLDFLLHAHLTEEAQRATVKIMLDDILAQIQQLSSIGKVTADVLKDIARNARRCHRAFENLREEANERSEAHRRERKRRWSEMKGATRRQVATPILQSLLDLTGRSLIDGAEDFVIHRIREEDADDAMM